LQKLVASQSEIHLMSAEMLHRKTDCRFGILAIGTPSERGTALRGALGTEFIFGRDRPRDRSLGGRTLIASKLKVKTWRQSSRAGRSAECPPCTDRTPPRTGRTRQPHTTAAHCRRTLLLHTAVAHCCCTLQPRTAAAHCRRTLTPHTTAAHCCCTLLPHTAAAHCCRALLPFTATAHYSRTLLLHTRLVKAR
jgi:hypothetical protein